MFSLPFSNKGFSLLEECVWQLWPGEKSGPKSGKLGLSLDSAFCVSSLLREPDRHAPEPQLFHVTQGQSSALPAGALC